MPEYTNNNKSKRKWTMHERRMYNAYVKKTMLTGGEPESPEVWINKRSKKKKDNV